MNYFNSQKGSPVTVQDPISTYKTLISKGDIRYDSDQQLAVEKLQFLYEQLKVDNPKTPKSIFTKIFGWDRGKLENVTAPGLYIYGGVGRGKSMLMDLFYDLAPTIHKRRVHFHSFMQEIHKALAVEREKHTVDPIITIAKSIAKDLVLLCFDEFQITDITDAMIVGRLFEQLFGMGVIIIATSNRHPDDLYKDGLNRQLFLPFIDLLKDNLEVFHLDAKTDYRKNCLLGKTIFISPLGPATHKKMNAFWSSLTTDNPTPLTLEVSGRKLIFPKYSDDVVQTNFDRLCIQPLGPLDYLTLAETIKILILEDIPQLSRAKNNEAKRFVILIDTLYEAKTLLIASAATQPEQLYKEGAGAFEFERTVSRLHEMQSKNWIKGRLS